MSSSHDITLTPQEQALIMRLKSFRVPEMAHILEEQLKDPNADLNTFLERMTAMVDAESVSYTHLNILSAPEISYSFQSVLCICSSVKSLHFSCSIRTNGYIIVA